MTPFYGVHDISLPPNWPYVLSSFDSRFLNDSFSFQISLDAQSPTYRLYTMTPSSTGVFDIDKCFDGTLVFSIDDYDSMPERFEGLKDEQVKEQYGGL